MTICQLQAINVKFGKVLGILDLSKIFLSTTFDLRLAYPKWRTQENQSLRTQSSEWPRRPSTVPPSRDGAEHRPWTCLHPRNLTQPASRSRRVKAKVKVKEGEESLDQAGNPRTSSKKRDSSPFTLQQRSRSTGPSLFIGSKFTSSFNAWRQSRENSRCLFLTSN
jgi:hypothetical protein